MIGNLLLLILILPLLGALILAFVPRDNHAQARGVALVATLLTLILSGILYLNFDHGTTNMQFGVSYDWINIANVFQDKALTIGFDLGVDGLSMPFVLLTAIVSFLAVLASSNVQYRAKEYFIWFL